MPNIPDWDDWYYVRNQKLGDILEDLRADPELEDMTDAELRKKAIDILTNRA
jgi:hypothetical protein